jgi:aminoglycoside phosphotransferase
VTRRRVPPGPDLVDELERLWWAAGWLPVPVPKVVTVDTDGAVLDDPPGTPATDHEPDVLRSLGEAVRRMHELPAGECPFDRSLAVEVPLAWGRVLTGDGEQAAFGDVLAMLPDKEDLVVTHGDLRLPNVLVEDGTVSGFTAIGRLGVADRHRDLAVIDASIRQQWGDEAVAAFVDGYGSDPDPTLLDFHLLVFGLLGPRPG